MFKKIISIGAVFLFIASILSSVVIQANEPDPIQIDDYQVSSLCDLEQCQMPKYKKNGTYSTSMSETNTTTNNSERSSICGRGDCPITDNVISNDLNYLQTGSNQQTSTLRFAVNFMRFLFSLLFGLSILSIVGGLITTIFLSVKRKKFALTPFLIFVFGIGFLVVSIICTTILGLASIF